MQFTSIEQIELALRVKKQSESGFFKNQRLLVIKSGFISYYSKIPKQFVGNTRSLQLIGEFPKYTLSAEFVTGITYNCPVLQVIFLKHKLIDRDGFEKMITSSLKDGNIDSKQMTSSETSCWHFRCKQVDLARAFVQQVKICMKPQPQAQEQSINPKDPRESLRNPQNPSKDPQNPLKDPLLQNRKSLQPSFKFVFDAFKQAKEQRQQKQIQQIINERASNYFSSSQIKNELKNRESVLNFEFLKNRQTMAKQHQIGLSQARFNQQTILKPIEMPRPYQVEKKVQQKNTKENKQQQSSVIKHIEQKVQVEILIQGDIDYFQSQTKQVQQKNSQQEQEEQVYEVIAKIEKQQQSQVQPTSDIFPQNNPPNPKEQSQQNKTSSEEQVRIEQLNQSSNKQPQQNPYHDEQDDPSKFIKSHNQHQNQHQDEQPAQEQEEEDDKQSVGKISSIYQNQDSQYHPPEIIQRNQSKASLFSLIKVLDSLNLKVEDQLTPKSLTIQQVIRSQQYSANFNNEVKKNQAQAEEFKQIEETSIKQQKSQFYHEENKQQKSNKTKQLTSVNIFRKQKLVQINQSNKSNNKNLTKNNNIKLKQTKKSTKSIIHQQRPSQSVQKEQTKQPKQIIESNKINKDSNKNIKDSVSYSFGVRKEPVQIEKNDTDRRIKDQIQQNFRDNIDCRKDELQKNKTNKMQKGKATIQKGKQTTKNQSQFNKFQTVKQITIHLHDSSTKLSPTSTKPLPQFKNNPIPNPTPSVNELFQKKQSLSDQISSSQASDKYFKLIDEYRKSKSLKKKYTFIMHTDFINYHSLIQSSQKDVDLFTFNQHLIYEANQTDNCIFTNYSSRLYQKFISYQFFAHHQALLSSQDVQQNSNIKHRVKIPIVFYMRYRHFEGLIIQKITQDQYINQPQIVKHKINKQTIRKKYMENMLNNSILSQHTKMNHKNSMKSFLQHFDLFLVDSIQNDTQQFYLLIEESNIKQTSNGQINGKKSLENRKTQKKLQKIINPSNSMVERQSPHILTLRYLFSQIEVLKQIKKVCIQQLIVGLQSRTANPINLSTSEKHVPINLIQQVLQKVIANPKIQTLLNIQESIQDPHQYVKKIQFIQNSIIFVLTQLLGFTIDSSKEIRHHVRIESVISQFKPQFCRKQKQQRQSLNFLVEKCYLLNEYFDGKRNYYSLEVLDTFNILIGSNKKIQKVLQLLSSFQHQQNQQQTHIINKIKDNIFSKTFQLLSQVEFVLQIVLKLQKKFTSKTNDSRGQKEKNHQFINNFIIRNSIILEFYIESQLIIQLFYKSLTENEKTQQNGLSVISQLNKYIEKSTNHIDELVNFLKQNTNSIINLKNDESKRQLQMLFQKTISTILHCYQNLFYLKHLQHEQLYKNDLRHKKQGLYNKIKDALNQIVFLQKIIKVLRSSTIQQTCITQEDKYHLQLIYLELKSQINPKHLSHQDLTQINKLLFISLNKKNHIHISRCLALFLNLWKQNIITDEQLIEIFAYISSIENLVESYFQLRDKITRFLTEQVTIQQRVIYLKKLPHLQKLLSPKPNSSFF